jgi:hypothetical protein
MSDFNPEDLRSDLKDQLKKGAKKGDATLNIVKYKHFIAPTYQHKLENSYLLKNFCIEAHVRLNKNPKANGEPQVSLDMVFGGEFEKGTNKVSKTKGQTWALQFQQQQLIAVLKFLEYSGYYTKYQSFVLKRYRENEFSKQQAEEYIDLYAEYKRYKELVKTNDAKKIVEELDEKLKEIEKDYDYPVIAPLRNVAFNKYLVERKKEEDRTEIDKKGILFLNFVVKEYKDSKKGMAESLKGFFGFNNSKKEAQDREEVKKLQEDLDSNFLKKYEIEEEKLNKEIDEFLKNKGTFDPDIVEEMPGDWTRLKLNLTMPESKLTLLHKDSTPNNPIKIVELQILKYVFITF